MALRALPLDPMIEAMADHVEEIVANSRGGSVVEGLAAFAALWRMGLRPQRIHTGYMPEEQRREVRHRLYSEGLRRPPARPSAGDRALAEAKKWGLAR